MAKIDAKSIWFTFGVILFTAVIVLMLFTRCCYTLADKISETTTITTTLSSESLS